MPNHFAEIYANNADPAVLGGIAAVASVGVCLVLRRIFIAVQRRRTKPDADLSECISGLPEESSWDWESPVDLATEPASSSQVAVASDTVDPDVRPQHANYLRFGVRIEYFDVISEPCESSPATQTDAVASARKIPQPGRLATSIREIADYAYRQVAAGRPIGLVSRLGVAAICLAVPLGYAMTRQNWVEIAPAISQAQDYAHRSLSRLFELQASAALDRPAHGGGRTNVELLSPDLTASRVQLGIAGAQAVGERELAGLEHRATEDERARSAALQRALLESRKQIDALRTSMAAADKSREERLRNELDAVRTLGALRRIAGDARTLLREATNYVFAEMPAAYLQRQRADRLIGDLSRARAQIEQLEAEAAEDRAKAKASLAQASGMLDDERRKSEDLRRDRAEMKLANAALVERADAAEQERTERERLEQTTAGTERALAQERAAAASTRDELRKALLDRDAAERERVKAEASLAQTGGMLDNERRKSEDLRRDLAEMKLANAALVERADAAEQERTGAVTARKRVEQTTAGTERALARERAAAASARDELKKARLERDAAEREQARAVTARKRAEQTATETAQALARERAAAVSAHEDLNKARLERDAARALLIEVASLEKALDKQREATVSLARELAAARADNDRLRAERRSAQIETPRKPRSGRAAAATGRMKVASQKTARSKVRNPTRVARVGSIPLPYSLRPRYATLE